uniref:NF-kappa-B essential modulator NEMO CC2-LZ domain-containing protein n=1 Tax=Callorhinchus milii TaxID=7868 RepID=A0A4W3GPC3_CALMI
MTLLGPQQSSREQIMHAVRSNTLDTKPKAQGQNKKENRSMEQEFEIISTHQLTNYTEESFIEKDVIGMEIEKQTKCSTDGREALEGQITLLENQKKELLEVNKQWDQQFRNMKEQYEQKVLQLRQRLTTSQRSLDDLETKLAQKQREFDKKLLFAKTKLETAEKKKQALNAELDESKELNTRLKEHNASVTKQKRYYEHEVDRLNKKLSEALAKQQVSFLHHSFQSGESLRKASSDEMRTQIEVLKHQVQIFEEDFQKERCDRERMNEEKEDLKKNIEHLQSKLTLLKAQILYSRPFPPLAYPACATCLKYQQPFAFPVHYPRPAMLMTQTGSSNYQHHPADYQWHLPCTNQISCVQQNCQNCRSKGTSSLKRDQK